MTSSCQGAASVRRIWCAEWQSVQTGAPALPRAASRPWMDCTYSARTPAWQAPQVTGMLARNTREVGSVRGLMSWAPWQSGQFAATSRPLREDARVAGAAGHRDARAEHPRGRLGARLDVVGAVAVGAVRGDEQAAPRDGAAVDRVHVELVDGADGDVVALRQLRVGVARGAGPE